MLSPYNSASISSESVSSFSPHSLPALSPLFSTSVVFFPPFLFLLFLLVKKKITPTSMVSEYNDISLLVYVCVCVCSHIFLKKYAIIYLFFE